MERIETVGTQVTPETKAALEQCAAEQKRSVAQILRFALQDYLSKHVVTEAAAVEQPIKSEGR